MTNAAIDLATVSLQLRFTRAAGADAAAELGHLHATSGKPRQQVIQLGKLHLKLAFTTARVSRKDIKNELGTVDHPGVHFFFDIALLGRREFVVHQDQVSLGRRSGAGDLLQLAFTDQSGRIGTITVLHKFAGNLRARGGCQFAELRQRLFHAGSGPWMIAIRALGGRSMSRSERER